MLREGTEGGAISRVRAASAPPPAVPAPLRRPIAALAIAAALVGAALGVVYSGASTAGTVDQWAFDALPRARTLASLIDFVGEPLGMAVSVTLLAALCLLLGRRRLALLAGAAPGLSAVVTTVLKPVVGRTIHGDFLAYPSGHTAVATALGLVLALLAVDLFQLGRHASLLLVVTGAATAGVAMAWSQVTLGAHYPTDTLGGFCAALAVVPATAWLVDRIADLGWIGSADRP